jgi:hypothetical protein
LRSPATSSCVAVNSASSTHRMTCFQGVQAAHEVAVFPRDDESVLIGTRFDAKHGAQVVPPKACHLLGDKEPAKRRGLAEDSLLGSDT